MRVRVVLHVGRDPDFDRLTDIIQSLLFVLVAVAPDCALIIDHDD